MNTQLPVTISTAIDSVGTRIIIKQPVRVAMIRTGLKALYLKLTFNGYLDRPLLDREVVAAKKALRESGAGVKFDDMQLKRQMASAVLLIERELNTNWQYALM